MPIQISLTEENVFVVNSENSKIIFSSGLRELKYLIINDDINERTGEVTLCFNKKNGFFSEINLKIFQKLEDFISAIVSLRSHLQMVYEAVNPLNNQRVYSEYNQSKIILE